MSILKALPAAYDADRDDAGGNADITHSEKGLGLVLCLMSGVLWICSVGEAHGHLWLMAACGVKTRLEDS